jgi:hypothetical protein
MSVGYAEVLAILIFLVCLWHAWNYEGRAFAQQWFFTGYIFALVRENLFASFQNISYADGILRFGSAPAALAMNFASFSYLAYAMARGLVKSESDWRGIAWRMFILVSAITLPLEFVATSFGWWNYPLSDPLYLFLGHLPYFVPFAWGASAALFYLVIARVRRIRFRGNGQFYALITTSPVIGVLGFPVHILVEFLVGLTISSGLSAIWSTLLALIWLVLPVIQLARAPQSQ